MNLNLNLQVSYLEPRDNVAAVCWNEKGEFLGYRWWNGEYWSDSGHNMDVYVMFWAEMPNLQPNSHPVPVSQPKDYSEVEEWLAKLKADDYPESYD
jgi:hypothetical protein